MSVESLFRAICDGDRSSVMRVVNEVGADASLKDADDHISISALEAAVMVDDPWTTSYLLRRGSFDLLMLDLALTVSAYHASGFAIQPLLEAGASALRVAKEGHELIPAAARAFGREMSRQMLLEWLTPPEDHSAGLDFGPPAAEDDIIRTLTVLLDHGAAIDARDDADMTALEGANSVGALRVAEFLIARGARQGLGSGRTARLVGAARSGNYDSVQELLADDADANLSNEDGDYALLVALDGRYHQIVDLLLEHGASPNVVGRTHDSAAHIVVRNGDREALRTLARHGSDVDIPNRSGQTALWQAAVSGQVDLALMLLGAGADPNIHHGGVALRRALIADPELEPHVLEQLVGLIDERTQRLANLCGMILRSERPAITRHISKHGGAGTLSHGEKRLSALGATALVGDPATASVLLGNRSLSARSLTQPLRYGCEFASSRVVSLLLDAGALLGEGSEFLVPSAAAARSRTAGHALLLKFIDPTSSDGRITAEFPPADEDEIIGMLRVLLDHGSRVDAKDDRGMTALERAAGDGALQVVKFLVMRGAAADRDTVDEQVLFVAAARNGNYAGVEQMVQAGIDIDRADRNGDYALLVAAEGGHNAILGALLGHGGDADVAGPSGDGLIHILVKRRDRENVAKAISLGVLVDRANDEGRTPLSQAVHSAQPEVVRMLLQAGADARGYFSGQPLLHGLVERTVSAGAEDRSASSGEASEIVSLLLHHGAVRDSLDAAGKSVLEVFAAGAPRDAAAHLLVVILTSYANTTHVGRALIIAARRGAVTSLQALLKASPSAEAVLAAFEVASERVPLADQLERRYLEATLERLLDEALPPETMTEHLHKAVQTDNHRLFGLLLEKGADLLEYLRRASEREGFLAVTTKRESFARLALAATLRSQILDLPVEGRAGALRELSVFENSMEWQPSPAFVNLGHRVVAPFDLRENPVSTLLGYRFGETREPGNYGFGISQEAVSGNFMGDPFMYRFSARLEIPAQERSEREMCFPLLEFTSQATKGADAQVTQAGQDPSSVKAGRSEKYDRAKGALTFEIAVGPTQRALVVSWDIIYNQGPDTRVSRNLDLEHRLDTYVRMAQLQRIGRLSDTELYAARSARVAVRAMTGRVIKASYFEHVKALFGPIKEELARTSLEVSRFRAFVLEHTELTQDVLPTLRDLAEELRRSSAPELTDLIDGILTAEELARQAELYLGLFENLLISRTTEIIARYQTLALEIAQFIPDEDLMDEFPITTKDAHRISATILKRDEKIHAEDVGGRGSRLRQHFLGRE